MSYSVEGYDRNSNDTYSISSFHTVTQVMELTVWSEYLLLTRIKKVQRSQFTVFSVSEDFLVQNTNTDHPRGQQQSNIRKQEVSFHRWTRWRGVSPPPYIYHIRRSSLGSGKGRPGFSGPADAVCFFSSALGLYVPSILLFFLMTQSNSSRAKLSMDSTVDTNTDTIGRITIAMVTDGSLRNRQYQSGLWGLCSYIRTNSASVR